MARTDVLTVALGYAERGLPVFPCVPGLKHPIVEHGFHDATVDGDVIRRWWSTWPHANVAMPTGRPGFDVLDIDVHSTGDGYTHLARLRAMGLLDGWTHVVKTPSGGMHVYFPGTEQRNGSVAAAHIDFRSTGGYVLVPPSEIESPAGTGRYELVAVNDAPGRPVDWSAIREALQPAAAPEGSARRPTMLAHAGATSGQAVRWLARHVATAPEGNRNAALFWASCRALEHGSADLRPLFDAARAAGLPAREAERTIASARRTIARTSPIRPNTRDETAPERQRQTVPPRPTR